MTFVTFCHLAYRLRGLFPLQPVSVLPFSWVNNTPHFVISMCSVMDISQCRVPTTIRSRPVMDISVVSTSLSVVNTHVQISGWAYGFGFPGCMPRNGSQTLSLWGSAKLFFQSDSNHFTFHQQCVSVLSFLRVPPTLATLPFLLWPSYGREVVFHCGFFCLFACFFNWFF